MGRATTSTGDPRPPERFLEMVDDDGRTRWRLDAGFLRSNWTCIWGAGCQGIHDEPRPDLHDGCCSVGVVLVDEDEARTVAALGAVIDPARFAHHEARPYAVEQGGRWVTRVVDGACVFFNPVGFAGGTGCALHLAALDDGVDPLERKPQTCTRMPIRVDEVQVDGATEVTVRAWTRDDWGPGGRTMAWWCTDAAEAHIGDRSVVASMEGPLRVLFGDERYARVVDALRRDRNPPGAL